MSDARIESAVRSILKSLGEDPRREGLRRTPSRVTRAWRELTSGYREEKNIDSLFRGRLFKVDYNEMVTVRDIQFYSLCEHHMLPFFGTATIAYVPDGRVVGLSKIPRLVRIFASRLQVQERMTQQIAETLQRHLKPLGVGVIITARHLCMEMRGCRSQLSPTVTSAMLGCFRRDPRTRDEFLRLAGK